MKHVKRALSLLLTLSLLLGCLSGLTLPASADTTYDLWVRDIQVSDANLQDVLEDGSGSVQFDPTTSTLTLRDGLDINWMPSKNGAIISWEGSTTLNVVLDGTVTLRDGYDLAHYAIYSPYRDIRVRGVALNISGVRSGICSNYGDILFDDPVNRTEVRITARQYGVYGQNVTIDHAALYVSVDGSDPDTYSNAYGKCNAAAVCAWYFSDQETASIRIGNDSDSGSTPNAIVDAACTATGSKCYALFAKSGITLADGEIVSSPSDGSIGADAANNNYVTVIDSLGGVVRSAVVMPLSQVPKDLDSYELWVNGVEVTMDNKDALLGASGSYFNADTNELHLRGTVALNQPMTAGGFDCAIYSTLPNLYLVLDDGCTASISGQDYGVVTDGGNLHVRGSGALSITGANVGILCSGGNLFFDGSDTTVQPQVTVSAAQHAVQAGSVYLWNVDLNAGTTGGTGDDPATYAAVYAAAGTTDGIIQIGTDGVEDWKNSATVYANAAHGYGLYAQDHLEIAGAMLIQTPARYLPFTGSECHYLRDAATGTWAPTVSVRPGSGASATAYDLWVGSVQVTDANRNNILRDGTAFFDPSANTLYLDGASISDDYLPPYAPSAHLYYTGTQALTIVVEGTVTLGGENNNANYGIYSTHADLHIRGSGTLDCGFKYFSCISLAGSSYDLYFDDPVNRPILRGESARYTVFAKNVYLRRAELYLHSTGSFPDDGNPCQAAAIYARISGSTVSSGRLEIGQSTGTDNVILEASVDQTGNGFYAVYGSITLADTERIVLPAGGGTSGSTIIDTRGRVAAAVRIEPQAAPVQPSEVYDLWLNGERVTIENKNSLPGLTGCTFDPSTNTLFLTGEATFDRGMVVSGVGCAIYSGLSDLYIVLDKGCVADLSGHQYGVYAASGCRVHIRGGGTLRMTDVDIGIDCGRGRNYSNDSGTILFDGQDPSYRPTVEIEAVRNCLLANEIYLWNVDLNAVVTKAGSAVDRSVFSPIKAITYLYVVNTYNPYSVSAGGIVEIGSGDGSEAWKNNAVVYATSPTNYAIFAEYAMYGDKVVTGEIRIAGGEHGERIWLPNNSSIEAYTNGPHGYYIKNTTTNAYSATVYIAPSGESPMEGTTFELWVNGFQVTGSNCNDLPGMGGSYYEPQKNVLYLSGRMTLNGTPEGRVDAPIYTTLNELTIVLDYGRAELCSEAHNYGIYSSGNLHIRGGSMLTVGNATLEGIHVGGTLSFDDPELTPTVTAYGHQYGLRAGSLALRQVELNAIVYSSGHTAGDGAVDNAAILVDRDLSIGTSSTNVSENNVTVYASCDVSGGYGVYAGQSVQHNATYVDVIEPANYQWANGSGGSNYVQDANGNTASIVQIATKLFYNIDVDEFTENGRLELRDHRDRKAFPGATVRVKAVPDEGYRCDGIVAIFGDDPTEVPVGNGSFTMRAEDVYLTATFSKIPYAVTGYADACGAVTADPAEAGIGDEVLLRVSPTQGYVLDTISIRDAGGNALSLTQTGAGYTFTMPASNVAVTAGFVPGSYTVTVAESEHGTVTPDAETPAFGRTVTLTAQADPGYYLQSVSVTDAAGGSVAVTGSTFVMPASNVTVTAVFALIDYTITAQPSQNGTVNAPATAKMGETVMLTVAPATGWQLDTLTVADGDGASVPVTAENKFVMPASNVMVTAVFAPIDYAITVDPATAALADVTAASTAHYLDAVTVTVTPHAGYTAGAITVTDAQGNNVPVSESSFTMPADHVTVSVQLTPIDYTVAVLPPANGSVAADKTVAHVGDVISLTVTPDQGYELERITVYDFSYNIYPVTDREFTMPAGNVIVVTSFTTAPYSVTVAETQHGSVVPSKYQASAGEYISLTVTPEEGWELASLTVTDGNGDPVPISGSRFAMPQSSVTIKAVFCSTAQTGEYFVGKSLTLAGDIGVNFYVKLNAVSEDNAKVVFTWGKNNTEIVELGDLDADAGGRYKAAAHVAAAEMTDAVTAKLYDGETLLAQTQYSVAQYARFILGASDETLLPLVNNNAEKAANLRALCKAMLIYGAKSQQQFKYNLYAPADQGIDYTLEAVPDGVLGSTAFPESFADQTGIAFYGSSLVLESKTTYRLYFTVTDQSKFDALTVRRGLETLTCGTRGDLIYFDIADIAAAQVFRDFTLTFGDIPVTCNAGQYVTNVLNGSDRTLHDNVTALYWYSEAAKAYFGTE